MGHPLSLVNVLVVRYSMEGRTKSFFLGPLGCGHRHLYKYIMGGPNQKTLQGDDLCSVLYQCPTMHFFLPCLHCGIIKGAVVDGGRKIRDDIIPIFLFFN